LPRISSDFTGKFAASGDPCPSALEIRRILNMFGGMKFFNRLLLSAAPLLFLASCANRTEFVPEGGPVTVGMPSELSDRERTYVGEVESTLRGSGYQPVRHDTGELALDFRIAQGPVNSDTVIELRDGRRVIARGAGRGSGVPMLGRDKRAEHSFRQAIEEFQTSLPQASSARVPAPAPSPGGAAEMEYVY
jgi:hypothetical protein